MANFSEMINDEKPVLVDFFAEWCGPCKIMAPELVKLKQMVGDTINIIKIDIDKNPSTAMHFNVNSVPTLMLFKKGKILWRQSGAMGAAQLSKIIQTKIS
jgi:thioredoxin 1